MYELVDKVGNKVSGDTLVDVLATSVAASFDLHGATLNVYSAHPGDFEHALTEVRGLGIGIVKNRPPRAPQGEGETWLKSE